MEPDPVYAAEGYRAAWGQVSEGLIMGCAVAVRWSERPDGWPMGPSKTLVKMDTVPSAMAKCL